jgi:CHAT domain-containing protein
MANRATRKLTLRRRLLRARRAGAVPALSFAPASLDEVAHRLPTDTQLLSFIVGEERSFALALSRDGRRIHELPRRAEIEAAATAFRAALLSYQYDRDAGLLLRRSLLDLTSPRVQRLLIVPDGPLHDVPWAALPDEDGGFIVGRLAVSVAPAASTVLVERAPHDYRARLIAFAAPAESARDDPSDAGVPRVRARVRPIPQTVREVESIARLFTGTDAADAPVIVRTREQATIGELLAVTARDGPAQYLHLACHGLVHPERPDLSGVVLTAPDRPDVEVWRVPEILHTDLRCELATLSACDTAIGPTVLGEGVISLGYALLAAGARHACVALWSVTDDAAPELMQHFYRALGAGLAPDLALARAQRETAQRRWRHPFYWAWPLLVQF